MTRLNQFLDVDDAARDRTALLSSLAGVVTFVLAKAIWGIEGKTLGWATFGATSSIYLVRVWQYCLTSQTKPARTVHFLFSRRLAMAAASVAILILFNIAPPSVVEAAIIDRRLRTLTRNKNLSPQQAEEVGSLLNTAVTGPPIKLPEETRVQVYQAIKNSALEHPNLPPLSNAVESLGRYIVAVSNAPLGSNEAVAAYTRGETYAEPIIAGPMIVPTPRPEEAKKAIAEFTRAIELAKATSDDSDLSSRALMMRATMYISIVQPNDTLRDIEAAEATGNADLSTALDLEATALLLRGGRDDLERVIRVCTLLANLAPSSKSPNDPAVTELFQIDAIGNIGNAHYLLGKFEDAIKNAESVLDRVDKDQGILKLERQDVLQVLRDAYLQLIASNLQLGNIDQAETVAHTWADKTGDPGARILILEIESGYWQSWLRGYSMKPILGNPAKVVKRDP